jgi:hypothetical protein
MPTHSQSTGANHEEFFDFEAFIDAQGVTNLGT